MAPKAAHGSTAPLSVSGPFPSSPEEAERLIQIVGECRRLRESLSLHFNQQVAAMKASVDKTLRELDEDHDQAEAALTSWATDNREELFVDGMKTLPMSSGELSFRLPPPSLVIDDQAALLKSLNRRGRTDCVQVKETPIARKLLAEPELVAKLPGCHIEQVEQFVIKPLNVLPRRAS